MDVRVAILEILSLDHGRTLSPKEMGLELKEELNRISYHVKELEKKGFIEIVHEEPVRGATEHFYALS